MAFRDDFDQPDLDTDVWLPHYLPAWSSRAQTRASYRLEDSCLVLDVPVDHPVWPIHEPPLRVSAVQSGSWSGPVGSVFGQQRFEEGQLVREEQPRFEGWLPASGHVEIRCRMTLSPRSMGALWLSGFEDDDEQLRCGELCVVEIFGRSVQDGYVRGRHGHQGVPRPRPHAGLRRPAAADRRRGASTPTPSTGTPTRRSSASTAVRYGAARARRRTRCS